MRYAFAQRLPFATQPVPKTAAAEEAEEAEEAIWHVASARERTTAHVCALQWSNAVAEEPNLTAQNADDAHKHRAATQCSQWRRWTW